MTMRTMMLVTAILVANAGTVGAAAPNEVEYNSVDSYEDTQVHVFPIQRYRDGC